MTEVRTFRQWLTFSALFAWGTLSLLILYSFAKSANGEAWQTFGFASLFAVVWLSLYAFRKSAPRTAGFIRFFLPLVMYGAMYETIHTMLTVSRPVLIDEILRLADIVLFGRDPVEWLGMNGHPLLTDFLYLSYFSYYFGMPVLLILMWRRNSETEFRRVLSAMTIGWYGALITYLLFPALGPQRFYPNELPTIEGMLPISGWIQTFLASTLSPNIRDCVPSMHTAITLLTLVYGFRFRRTFFWIYLPFGCGLILATVYTQQHYAVDVLFGVLAAYAIYMIVKKFSPQ